METQTAEIAPNIYRLSTYVQDANLVFNQFLVVDEEPLLFHTGPRDVPPRIRSGARFVPVEPAALDHVRSCRG